MLLRVAMLVEHTERDPAEDVGGEPLLSVLLLKRFCQLTAAGTKPRRQLASRRPRSVLAEVITA